MSPAAKTAVSYMIYIQNLRIVHHREGNPVSLGMESNNMFMMLGDSFCGSEKS